MKYGFVFFAFLILSCHKIRYGMVYAMWHCQDRLGRDSAYMIMIDDTADRDRHAMYEVSRQEYNRLNLGKIIPFQ